MAQRDTKKIKLHKVDNGLCAQYLFRRPHNPDYNFIKIFFLIKDNRQYQN